MLITIGFICLAAGATCAAIRSAYWHERYKEEVKEKWYWKNQTYHLAHADPDGKGTAERYYD